MAFAAHESFIAPESGDAKIWRYMDVAKLLSLLDKRALFFVRVDKLSDQDPFEGYYTNAMVKTDQLSFNDLPEGWKAGGIKDEKLWESVRLSNAQIREFVKTHRQFTFVNSWHMQQYESAAMWAQYLKSEDGIAVQSTYRRLIDSLADFADFSVQIGRVHYIDYEREMIPVGNIFFPYMYKRKSFEHERELRCLIWIVEHGKVDMHKPELNPFKDKSGMYVQVKLPTLIEKVFVAPTAPSWLRETLQSIVREFDVDLDVAQSDLSSVPLY
jgi:hypothetical protein